MSTVTEDRATETNAGRVAAQQPVEERAPPPPLQGRLADLPASLWWAAVSIALMVVGAFGPWVSVVGGSTINGTDGSRDGWLVFGAAVLATLLLFGYVARRRPWYAIGAMLVGLASAATAAYDITDLNNRMSTGNDLASIEWLIGNEVASIEWGIYLSQAASISLALASLALVVKTWRKREPSDAPG
jgi:hypothetical protein